MPPEELYLSDTHKANAQVFKALCDPKRLAILEILQHGSQCACDLIQQTGIPQSALSYHMKILVESTLVHSWQVGKWTHYQISPEGGKNAVLLLETLLKVDPQFHENHCENQ